MAIKILNDLLPVANPEDLGAIIPDNKSIKITEEGKLSSQLVDIPENIVTSDNYSDAKIWKGTLAEYEAMESYDDAITYIITDDSQVIDLIKDNSPSLDSTYSSIKIENMFNSFLPNKLNNQNKYLMIQDNQLIWNEALNYNNITNCFTKLPKNINFSLTNDGVITIQAGSKIYIPNGINTFEEIELDTDLQRDLKGSLSTTAKVFYQKDENRIIHIHDSGIFTSDTQPFEFSDSIAIWYDTSTGIIKRTDDNGKTWTENGISLPLLTCNVSPTTASINQVFNNFGYMDKLVFALPNTEGLFSNGLNDDGKLIFINFKIDNVIIFNTFKNAYNYYIGLFYTPNIEIQMRNSNNSVFDAVNNKWYNPETGNEFKYLIFGKIITNEIAKITEFNFEAQTCTLILNTDRRWASTQSKPSNKRINLELGASESQYTAPDNGWFLISGYDKGQGLDIANITTGLGYCSTGRTNDGFIRLSIPVSKNDIVKIYYTEFEKIQFNFIYDNGVA